MGARTSQRAIGVVWLFTPTVTPSSDHKVLIVAPDPVLAALVGSVVELSRLRAAFPRADERPEDALTRVKPLIAILIDALADEAESDIFLARARKKGVHLLLFGGAAAAKARRPWAEARGIPVYTLPDEVQALEESIRRIAAGAGKSARTFERRDKPASAPLIMQDRAGKRWEVYDRRSKDRRQHVIDREFISETGEVRHCHIDEREAASTSPQALIDQLERATSEATN
jgi:hypothetical protein